MTTALTPPALRALAPLLQHLRRHRVPAEEDPTVLLDGLETVLPDAEAVFAAIPPAERDGSDTSVLLHAEPGLSVVAMVTRPGQQTTIHDHVSWCVSVLLAGEEHEETFVMADPAARLRRLARRDNRARALSAAGPDQIHRVTNRGRGTALSLHVYAADLSAGRSSVRTAFDLPVSDELAVPGARIYHEERGAGPVLLLIPGGAEDADAMVPLATALADRWTTLTLDPRGNSRSTLTGPAADVDVEQHADDAARLLRRLGSGPAAVVGTSGGAQVALALAVRHPELVSTVVAHEPPCLHVLDDPTQALAADQAVLDAYAEGGVPAAIAVFAGDNELPPLDPATWARMEVNLDHFLTYGLVPISAYLPDIAALRTGTPQIHVAVGAESSGLPIDVIARTLAAHLGTEPVQLPGDHLGLILHAEECASTLSALMAEAGRAPASRTTGGLLRTRPGNVR